MNIVMLLSVERFVEKRPIFYQRKIKLALDVLYHVWNSNMPFMREYRIRSESLPNMVHSCKRPYAFEANYI